MFMDVHILLLYSPRIVVQFLETFDMLFCSWLEWLVGLCVTIFCSQHGGLDMGQSLPMLRMFPLDFQYLS